MLLKHPEEKLAIGGSLLEEAREAWVENTRERTTEGPASGFQLHVSSTLSTLGIQHDVEHITEDGLFALDIRLHGTLALTLSLMFGCGKFFVAIFCFALFHFLPYFLTLALPLALAQYSCIIPRKFMIQALKGLGAVKR